MSPQPPPDRPDQVVALLGAGLIDRDVAVLLADDLGLTRGDGCFDATLVRRGEAAVEVFDLDAHLVRFARSARLLGLPEPDARAWRALVAQLVQAWTSPVEAVLKLMLTRGPESHPGEAVGVATLTALPDSTLQAREGIDVVTLSRGHASDAFRDAPWLLGGVKTLAYAVNTAATREARNRGADDALFVSTDGFALEGPTSALVVRRGNTLVTTPKGPTGILPSVTLARIFDRADRDGIATRHELVPTARLLDLDGAWLVSSVRGVAPIRHLDGHPVAQNHDWTRRLRAFSGGR